MFLLAVRARSLKGRSATRQESCGNRRFVPKEARDAADLGKTAGEREVVHKC